MQRTLTMLIGVVSLGGCTASTSSSRGADEAVEAEIVATASEASTAGDACVVACATGYAALCYRVTAVCQAAEVVTLGGASVPCAAAKATACIGGVALAAICQRRCPP
jgi:hypothetical protein